MRLQCREMQVNFILDFLFELFKLIYKYYMPNITFSSGDIF